MGYGNQKTSSFAGETQGKSVRKVEKTFMPKYRVVSSAADRR
jgi:hypothetical protein